MSSAPAKTRAVPGHDERCGGRHVPGRDESREDRHEVRHVHEPEARRLRCAVMSAPSVDQGSTLAHYVARRNPLDACVCTMGTMTATVVLPLPVWTRRHMTDPLLTSGQVAGMLGVHRTSVWRIKPHLLAYETVNGHRRYRIDDVRQYVLRHTPAGDLAERVAELERRVAKLEGDR